MSTAYPASMNQRSGSGWASLRRAGAVLGLQQRLGAAIRRWPNRSIAPHFETLDGTRGTDPEYLRKLLGRHGMPPALEPGSVGSSPS